MIAPGVAEYNQFMKLLNRRYRDAAYGDASYGNNYPGFGSPEGMNGIPLESTLENYGRAVGIVVTKIESRAIPPSQFEVPAGFVIVRPSIHYQHNDIAEKLSPAWWSEAETLKSPRHVSVKLGRDLLHHVAFCNCLLGRRDLHIGHLQ
jgi:hypothetical protein